MVATSVYRTEVSQCQRAIIGPLVFRSAPMVTCEFGQDDLLYDGWQQVVVHVPPLQGAVLIEAVEQQRLEPDHVLEVFTLSLNRNRKKRRKVDVRTEVCVTKLSWNPDGSHTPPEGSM